MATLTVPYSFVPATSIVASEMNSNFGAVKTFVEALAAGTNLDTGSIASSKLAAATIQLLAPTGSINAYAGSVAPSGWLLCDGTAVSRATYADLFALISTTYGAGDGATTFNLPNLKGRVIVGRDAAQTEFDALAETGGAKTHTLAESEIPSHLHGDGTLATNSQLGAHNHSSGTLGTNSQLGNHQHGVGGYTIGVESNHAHSFTLPATPGGNVTTVAPSPGIGVIASNTNGTSSGATDVGSSSHTHTFTGTSSDANLAHSHAVNTGNTGDTNLAHSHDVTGNTGNTGGGAAHNNLQPYLVVNYIIKI